MASEKVAMILRSRTELAVEQISALSDAEAWQIVYELKPAANREKKNASQICMTGFVPPDRSRLEQVAVAHGLRVVKSVTRSLAFLVIGPNAGPAKCKLAREQDVVIMNETQFGKFLQDGEVPL